MQILQRFDGSVSEYQQYVAQTGPDSNRPGSCPQCLSPRPLIARGFYHRTIGTPQFDGIIAVRRYLCKDCKRTVSLLPQFALPYLRSSVGVIALFLLARLLDAHTLRRSLPALVPYQRGQFWVRRFRLQAGSLCLALAGATSPLVTAPDFVQRALLLLTARGWVPSHCFLFAVLRQHLLGWPPVSLRMAATSRFPTPPAPPDPKHRPFA